MSKKSPNIQKSEDPSSYAKLANEGVLLGYPVKIVGQHARPDNGIHYHSSIKFFDPKDHPHAIHQLAQHLPLNPPDAKNTQIEPGQFKDRLGNDVYVLKLHGNSAAKLKEHNGKFAHMGPPTNYEFAPHISVDKATWDKIKSSGAKTAHEAGISFGNAQLKKGPKVLKTYHHEPDSTEPKVPDEGDLTAKMNTPKTQKSEEIHGKKPLMKPYVSEAQRRWAHTSSGKEALGGNAGVHEWDEATKGKKLPERVKPIEKGALKNAGLALGAAAAMATGANSVHAQTPQHAGLKPGRSIASIPGHAGTSSYDHNKMLNAIAQIESSGGKNMNHKPTSQGTAFGRYALMPNTIHDTIKGHKDLKAKYGKALALNGPQLHRFMQDNKGLEDIIANRHLSHIEHNFNNDPEKISFSWNQGITGTKNAKNKGIDISNHPYVKKIKHIYGKG